MQSYHISPWWPAVASTNAVRVDTLFVAWWIITGITLVVTVAVMITFAVRYRRGSPHNRVIGPFNELHWEWAWILGSAGIFFGMFVWGAWDYYQEYNPPPGAMQVYVVGKQWMWKIQHADGRREINQLHVPVGVPVKLVMSSQDVIHSFFVPAFRIKQDVLPGSYTSEWFQATQIGEYHLFCAEYCGTQHSKMGGTIDVMSQNDYQHWLASAPSGQSLVERGAGLFRSYGCSGCHGTNAAVHAPSLVGLYGKPVALRGGGTVVADDAYLHDSILLSTKQVVAGYKPIMPLFRGQISEEDVRALIAYIKSLSPETPDTRIAP